MLPSRSVCCLEFRDGLSEVQASVGSRIIARETVKAVRKNVLLKSGKVVGGGDKSRKQKLLAKQKRGKARMKRVGKVSLPQEAFLSVIRR